MGTISALDGRVTAGQRAILPRKVKRCPRKATALSGIQHTVAFFINSNKQE
ncbi:hypothetical protein GH741_05575 [Aquibacillus halophilus]|uniref:Uncharacterized protein n=1 Tax=Aquibacillus halophilus TaxID=930132 RepID=A0A6A8D8Q9_9BACI|nr:hypothetical protein [Aquibacillus halophilus]MRH42145.1 hypothetical protein [Aquibacillus halophilus]